MRNENESRDWFRQHPEAIEYVEKLNNEVRQQLDDMRRRFSEYLQKQRIEEMTLQFKDLRME